MKVLFFHDGPLRVDEHNNYYGVSFNSQMFERYYDIAEELEVVIRLKSILEKEGTKRLSKINLSPFKVIEMPNISSIKGMIFKKRAAKRKIERAVLEADYIVARLPSRSGFIAIDYAIKHNKPYLTEVVACAWDGHWNHSIRGKLVAPFMYFATKRRVKNSKHAVYVTNEFLQNRYPTKGEYVNCSNVALTEFDKGVSDRRINKIKNLNDENTIVIGTTASVNVRYKGQQFIIEALGRLKEQGNTNYEYQLVGDGNQSYLRSIAKKYNVTDQVKFLGPMLHNEVFDWLDTIDLYVQPSRQEGLPRALIEAMSRGLPAFGARTAGIPELLEDKYIFSNTRSNIKEISTILVNYSKEQMETQSKQNYKEAQKYDKLIIDNRRKVFFEKFRTKNR